MAGIPRNDLLYLGGAAAAGYASAYAATEGQAIHLASAVGASAGLGLGLVASGYIDCRSAVSCAAAKAGAAGASAAALVLVFSWLAGADRRSTLSATGLSAVATGLLVGVGELLRGTSG